MPAGALMHTRFTCGENVKWKILAHDTANACIVVNVESEGEKKRGNSIALVDKIPGVVRGETIVRT